MSAFGRFEVHRRLGSGAFATVYLAHDAALDAPVALKVLAENHSAEPELRERFVREARLLRRLSAETGAAQRLVAVHDIGEEEGQPYLVLEYLPRGTLAGRLSGDGPTRPLGEPALRRLADELAACLDAVHARDVTHRDVTPSNLLIRGGARQEAPGIEAPDGTRAVLAVDETLVLADFGLARNADQTNLTIAAGTPGYAAPEQLRASTDVGPRADLYAATAILLEVAHGSAVRSVDLDGLLGDAAAALRRCLAEDPAERPADVAAWRAAIEPALGPLARLAPGTGGDDPPGTGARGGPDRPSGVLASLVPASRRPRRVVLAVAAAAAVLLATVVGTVTATRTGTEGSDAALSASNEPRALGEDPLSTDGSRVVDAAGDRVRLRGVNWLGLEGADCTLAGLRVRSLDSLVRGVARQGFTMIRVPFASRCLSDQASGLEDELHPELVGSSGTELLDALVASARSHGLRVLLARQLSGSPGEEPDGAELWYSEAYPEEQWIADWVDLAQRYRGESTVIGADLDNEPHGEACWGCGDPARDWRAAAQRAGNAVLAANPDWLVVVQGVELSAEGVYNWRGSQLADVAEQPVRLDIDDRLVYSAHDFPPSVYAQQWFDDAAGFPEALPRHWEAQWAYLATSQQAPVLLGAFGSALRTPADRRWMRTLVEFLDENRIDYAYWSLTPAETTGSLLDEDYARWDQQKLEALRPVLGGSGRAGS